MVMIGTLIAGKYRIDKKIGQGGFGEVYRGFDTNLKRDVAIKFLTDLGYEESFKKRFIREAELSAKLMHPSIVAVFDFGEFKGRPYLVLELVNGPSLTELSAKTSIPLRKVIQYARQACRGMAYAHGQGVIHRDLSLNNIMINERDEVKIVDFGLAKLMGSDSHYTPQVTGTPFYLAPEQIKGQSFDHRIDIFAFGVCLFRLANGYFPFQAEHPTAVLYEIVHETEYKFAEGIPEDLKDIIVKCLEKDPADRYPDFNQIGNDLGALVAASLDTSMEPPVAVYSYVRSSKRNPYLNRVMIKHPEDFFGRKKEIKKIYSRLDAPHPQSISIVGDRRTGKSSLLNYVYHRTNRRQSMQNYQNSIFIYMDFQRSPDITVPMFIDMLFSMFEFEQKKELPSITGEKNLDHLKNMIQELSSKDKRVILLMDEFEMVTKNENFDMQFFSFMRFLANNFKVAYVTSSAKDLQQLCHTKDIADSPFFNIFSNLPLRTFTHEEAVELITVPSEKEGIPLALHASRILELSGYFPLYIQIACSSVYEWLLENRDAEPDWEEIAQSYRDEVRPHYSFVWEKMDDASKETICYVARGESIGDKHKHIGEDLLRRGYLREDGKGLGVFSSTFGDFVSEPGHKLLARKSIFSLSWRKMGKKRNSENR
jgi:serine/threonine protein kinase